MTGTSAHTAAKVLEPSEKYRAAIQLTGTSEAATWSRMTSFLAIAGLLVNAQSLQGPHGELRHVIPLTGLGISLTFFLLMWRSRTVIAGYVDYAKTLEGSDGPLTTGAIKAAGIGSKWIAPAIPVGFALVFAYVLFNSWF